MKFKLVENLNYEDAKHDYRCFADIDEDFEITKENIDEWALNETCAKHNIRKYDLRNALLGEDITIDQAAREAEAETVEADNKNQIEKALDKSLKRARQMRGARGDFPNLLLISEPGMAKTSVVKQWAEANNINLVYKDAKTMDPAALGGIVARDSEDARYATRLGTQELRSLEQPNSVLFLDEFNRARSEIRGSLLTLVQDHVVWDPNEPGEMKYLPNFLFTVAAVNPSSSTNVGAKKLEPAEKGRFRTIRINPDPQEHLNYLKKFYTSEIEKAEDPEIKKEMMGRLELAKKILTDPDFTYDTTEEIEDNWDDDSYEQLSYRSFKQVLDMSDGTKADFLDLWNDYCNYKKKSVVKQILSDYVDIDDKATQAIKGETESPIFQKRKSNRDLLKNLYPELNI